LKKIIAFLNLTLYEKLFLIKKRIYFLNKILYGKFGFKSIINNPMFIPNKKNIYIGDNVTIRDYARIEPIIKWRDISYNPKVIIGDNTNIEQNLHLTCANKVQIGNNVLITAGVTITDIDHEYNDISKGVLEQGIIVKETILGDRCFIGMGCRIMAGVNIGNNCVIGANSVVTMDIPDNCVAVGIPAKIIKIYDFKSGAWEKINN
jgi:acetyltransferase-like isoleucine patch superfamily enzyme